MQEVKLKISVVDAEVKSQTIILDGQEKYTTPDSRGVEVNVRNESIFERGMDLTQFPKAKQIIFEATDDSRTESQIVRNEKFVEDKDTKPFSKDRR